MNATMETLNLDREPSQPDLLLESDAPGSPDARPIVMASDALCFRHAVPVALSAGAVAPVRLDPVRLTRGLSELSEVEIAALGRLLPILLCGEESAFQVFWREGHKASNVQISRSEALANQIALEELEHERLLQELRSCCPVPHDVASTLLRTRRFFLRMASRDPAVHFAKVAALDSAVCILLSALAKPLLRAPHSSRSSTEFAGMKRDMSGFRAGTRTSLGRTHRCSRTLRLAFATNLWPYFTRSGTHSKL